MDFPLLSYYSVKRNNVNNSIQICIQFFEFLIETNSYGLWLTVCLNYTGLLKLL